MDKPAIIFTMPSTLYQGLTDLTCNQLLTLTLSPDTLLYLMDITYAAHTATVKLNRILLDQHSRLRLLPAATYQSLDPLELRAWCHFTTHPHQRFTVGIGLQSLSTAKGQDFIAYFERIN